MSSVVVFLIFVICLIVAIPVSISLGIVSVLPGMFDPSFTASGTFVIRSMLGGLDSFPAFGSSDVCVVRNYYGERRYFEKAV